MQRERGPLDSFPETIDLNQGSLPNSTSMDQSDPWDSMLSPVENRWSDYMLSSTEENVSRSNASNDPSAGFSFWDRGESSSNTSAMQDGVCGDDSKTRLGWSGVRSEDWSFEPSGSTSYSTRTLDMHSYSPNRGSLNGSLSHGCFREHDDHRGIGAGLPLHKSGYPQMDPNATFYASSSNVGTTSASSSSFSEIHDASSLPFSNWGTSCKRKALEGTSEQFHPGGSSSSIRPMENIIQPPVPTCYPGSRNLSISSTLNLSPLNRLEHLNPSTGSGMSNVPLGSFPPSGVPVVGETSTRNFSIRSNHGRHETIPFDTPRGASVRRFGVSSAHSSRAMANTDLNELRSPMTPQLNPNNLRRPPLDHVNEARGMHSYPWDGSYSSRIGSSSGSLMTSGERGSGAREEATVRSSGRNHLEYLMAASSAETSNISQGQIDWSFSPGSSSSSRDQSSDPQIGLGSGGQSSLSGWLSREIQTSPNHQQLSETAPWIPFPHAELDFGNRRRHFSVLPSSSSSEEIAPSRHAQHQLRRSSAALLMDMPGNDVNGWRALAAVEGRHRLIRHVLSAMRRGANLQAEDYMFIDPFINGIAEMHDRHRDMRLDVDNMSYEELLALEERIGNVNTGLSEEKIMSLMKLRKHVAGMCISPNLEPCCICQENYVGGDDIGILDCGHEFHTVCVKQWLMLKNLCPICKTTALDT